jgi:hypothetical protein
MKTEQITETLQQGEIKAIEKGAFEYLLSLPPSPRAQDLEEYREKAPCEEIACGTAAEFTERFRSVADDMDIPVSWSFDKDALVKLLGITSYEHYSEVNGIRFYAGVNGDGVMALVAVSTTTGTRLNCVDCRDDLTKADDYPYYDYADPCPTNCSNTGNLKAVGLEESLRNFTRTV